MDDILPGTKPPSIVVMFVDIPEHTETELGSSVLLACRTANPVAECQWSWQPLPPIHLPLPDVSESPSVSTSKRDIRGSVSRLDPDEYSYVIGEESSMINSCERSNFRMIDYISF